MSTFTHEQVASHNTKEDLYMIVHNKVYNITEFVDEVSTRNFFLSSAIQDTLIDANKSYSILEVKKSSSTRVPKMLVKLSRMLVTLMKPVNCWKSIMLVIWTKL
jgi:hypothetical protein